MVMFDTLNRHMLSPYGCDWTHTPNFARLAKKTVVFDNCYVGSMPCIPARRELHTGRYNFLHRSWGPLEPFDNSMPEILKKQGVYTHLVTDHNHYWEDGGCTYHPRYNSFELVRGQEGDPGHGEVKEPDIVETVDGRTGFMVRQDWVNRKRLKTEDDFPQAQTFSKGLNFIRNNYQEDNWFLQLETFDPHEPFHTPGKYKDLYPHAYKGRHFDWPLYRPVTESPDEIEHCRYEYASLLSMCDAHLGKVLDVMDELELWDDTMLIVNTDHGFLLGEHGWWGKMVMPLYEEISHIPLFIWDPRSKKCDERRQSLVQTIDLAPTLLNYFGIEVPNEMQGIPLRDTIKEDQQIRSAAIFGIHGGNVNCTDGRYVYMRAPQFSENEPLYNYTLMPTHMQGPFSTKELQTIQLHAPFSFTRGLKTMKIKVDHSVNHHKFGTMLFDTQVDPVQTVALNEPDIEQRMIYEMVRIMKESDAPSEQFERLGLPDEGVPIN